MKSELHPPLSLISETTRSTFLEKNGKYRASFIVYMKILKFSRKKREKRQDNVSRRCYKFVHV